MDAMSIGVEGQSRKHDQADHRLRDTGELQLAHALRQHRLEPAGADNGEDFVLDVFYREASGDQP